MKPAAVLIAASGLLLLASHRGSVASIEDGADGAGLDSFSIQGITDSAETLFNQLTEQPSDTDMDTAAANITAFLATIRQSEGTEGPDPYRTCYGYGHTVQDMSDHPTVTGEWPGVVLPPEMCANCGFGPGCKSTAAGAYQIIRPTWLRLRNSLGLPDFSAASQDRAAIELVRSRGALEDVKAGRVVNAIGKCRQEWASLPGNSAKQGQRSLSTLVAWYSTAGGAIA